MDLLHISAHHLLADDRLGGKRSENDRLTTIPA
jgi:hypothetical protein